MVDIIIDMLLIMAAVLIVFRWIEKFDHWWYYRKHPFTRMNEQMREKK